MSDNNKDTKKAKTNEVKPIQLQAPSTTALSLLTIGASVVALGFWAASRYKVAAPNQYMVKTGMGIERIFVSKNTFVWPFQEVRIINVNPQTYDLKLNAMSMEKMPFLLPGVFTIAPDTLNQSSLMTYAEKFVGVSREEAHSLIEGVIEGDTRLVASKLTLEQIFADRTTFKKEIHDIVEKGLIEELGLKIINANIKELQDEEHSKYFEYLRQRTIEGASNKARVEVAEAESSGTQGQKLHTVAARKRVAELEADAVQTENKKHQEMEISKAELEKIRIEQSQQISIARALSAAAVEQKQQELQTIVEQKRLEQNKEAIRAKELAKIKVAAENRVLEAQGVADAIKIEADGKAYARNREAESFAFKVKQEAEAEAYKIKQEAEAHMYAKQREAEGIIKYYDAQADGLAKLRESCKGDGFNNVLNHMMVEKELYVKLAKENAHAIQGLNPKYTIWNTNGTDGKQQADPIKDILSKLPPLLTTIQDQTGITPPEWLLKMPPKQPEQK